MIRRRGPGSGVFLGIASFGTRARMLKTAVESLIDQVDRMGVYLNNYPEVPQFLHHPRIEVARSQDHGDQRDNGKFFFLSRSDLRYYAAADDDLKYPSDYVARMKSALADTGSMSAVAVHGAVYPTPIIDLFHSRRLFHYAESLQHIMPVHLVGTGTVFFDQQEWNLRFEEFGDPGMADIWFARSAQNRGARLFAVNRKRNWLLDLGPDGGLAQFKGDTSSLFAEFRFRTDRHTKLLVEAEVADRGYEGLIESILASDILSERLSISQALELERLRKDMGYQPLETQSGNSIKARLEDVRIEWSDHPVAPDEFQRGHADTISAILSGSLTGEVASSALDLLENIAALRQSNEKAWKSLPYSLRFDSRRDRAENIRKEIAQCAAQTGKELAALWPRLSKRPYAVTPQVALAFEEAGFNTDFQSLPLLRSGTMQDAGRLLRDYFQERKWSVPQNLTAWRQIFGSGFDSKPVQLLVASTAILGGNLGMAQRCLDRLRHLWPRDADVALLGAMLTAATADVLSDAFTPVIAVLDPIVEDVGLRSYGQLLRSGRVDASHWLDLFEMGGGQAGVAGPPEVSVIMTVHNGADTVRAAAWSVLASTDVDLELLIVDDSSTDDTQTRVGEIDDPRVRLITNDHNVGPYVSRNRALEVATGDFVTIADADDWTHPDRIAYQRDRLRSEPGLWACTVSQLRVTPTGIPDLENHLLFLGDGPMSLMFRRRLLDQIGGFDHIRTRGDMEFMSRLIARFGQSALTAFGVPLVLSTASPMSNSKRFSPDSLDRYRLAFRRWHEVAALSDALYVSLKGNRAPFIAPAELVVTDAR